jgi:ubiquinone/menaquinone biosynthesis C-methylase UbiE
MRFEHAEEWAKVFDDPARDAWQKPDQVIDALRLDANARVADIGAGTGYFSARIAKRIPNGVVYAIDVEPDMVHFLCDRAKREGLENLKPVLSAADDPKAPEVDIVLVVDTYHHIPSREAYFQKIKAKKIAIVDFTKESEMGPPAEHRIPPEQVDRELGTSGWKRTQTHTFLPNQYFLVFEK